MHSGTSRRIVIGLACLLPLAFAAFTHHAWEDFFITLRSSRNLVEGHGLVFNPGERVHTFTSPLGVLLPALGLGLGHGDDRVALWLFRLLSAALLAGGAALVWRRAEAFGLGRTGRVVLFGLLLTDAKLTDFAINGQETALCVFFLLLLWSELEAAGPPRPAWLAAACAGLMWTRPDGFILGGALIAATVLIRRRGADAPPVPWAALARGLLWGGLLYLPWFAWAWWYYGSPIPHTVVAKAAVTPPVNIAALVLTPLRALTGQARLEDLFLPTYWAFGGWPVAAAVLAKVLAAIAAFAWVVPGLPAPGRRASLALFLGMFYLDAIILFPWYVPPWTVLAFLALAWTVDGLHARLAAAGRRGWLRAVRVAALVVVGVQAALFVAVAWQTRLQQRWIEDHNRRAIGLWLRDHAAPTDTVFLEPLGYIGYFSRLRTYDFPGLSSPEVTAAIRSGAKSFADLIARLHPDWLVLRADEMYAPNEGSRRIRHDYQFVRLWDSQPDLDQINILPGREWLEVDAQYAVWRRKTAP
ncbi:MAG TPA: hypothetical protein VMD31_13245 [Opitutaceae bacterium]|nr:hypothetical protein [Opitutaceae bacterium]